MILAFTGGKGGSGKSTAAIAAAVDWFARRKRRVALVDCDPQRSLLTWAAVAGEAGHAAPLVVAMGEGLSKPGQLPALAGAHDVTILDLPGRLDKVVREALLVADLAVLPCGPSAMDVWALGESLDLVTRARTLRPELRVALLVNRLQPRTALARATREALEASGVPLLAAALGDRVAYREAPAAGQGPTTYAPTSPAAREVRALVTELERMVD